MVVLPLCVSSKNKKLYNKLKVRIMVCSTTTSAVTLDRPSPQCFKLVTCMLPLHMSRIINSQALYKCKPQELLDPIAKPNM